MKRILFSALVLAVLSGCSQGIDQTRVEALEHMLKAAGNDCPLLKVGEKVSFDMLDYSLMSGTVTETSGRWFRIDKPDWENTWINLDQVILMEKTR